ncbi:MAG: NYN domain-containing protein [Bacillota bacterium]
MKIAVFVDGANFFYTQRDGLKWWVDPKRLLDFLGKKGEIVDAYYYIGKSAPPEARQQGYLKALACMGYSLVTKELKSILQDDGTYRQKANLDIEIVLDMFNTIENYDCAVLVSGDCDFERPLQLLRSRGKKFLVMSTEGFVSQELRAVAGMHYIDFENIKDQVEKDS